ncbi:MAG: gamma-glutamylcyclotransferase, partial [Alphaproteobacteria bacterium]
MSLFDRSPVELIKSFAKDGSVGAGDLKKGDRLTPERAVETMHTLRKNGFNGRPIEDWQESLKQVLEAHPQGAPLFVFGYGSLMWNPMIPHQGMLPARITQYARSFCMNVTFGRGSDDHPGLMLALDEIGGDEMEGDGTPCWGRLIAVAPEDVEHAYCLLWIREMGGDGYVFRHLDAETEDGPIAAITFTVNRKGDRYLG